MELRIKTPRLVLAPFDMAYLEDYFREFNGEITRYQYPDPYQSLGGARAGLQDFLDGMERGELLFLSILTPDGAFLGGVEVHGLREPRPELGVWVKEAAQRQGYAYEALSHVLAYVDQAYQKTWYVYEADVRNRGSMKLVERFAFQTEGELDEFQTETGKDLRLQKFLIKRKSAG